MQKKIALVAHDQKKPEMVEWAKKHADKLKGHQLFATGTTGRLIKENTNGLDITPMKSGPLGGDQQLGAMICEGQLDILFFFTDPMTPQPHDVDIKALLRLSTMYNCVEGSNLATADFVIESPLFDQQQDHSSDFSDYANRTL